MVKMMIQGRQSRAMDGLPQMTSGTVEDATATEAVERPELVVASTNRTFCLKMAAKEKKFVVLMSQVQQMLMQLALFSSMMLTAISDRLLLSVKKWNL
jgi:hypothetical protein